jgi:anti-sigma regulatory factor (Ser/Thr protein kinase)
MDEGRDGMVTVLHTTLPAEPLSARQARRFVTSALSELGLPELTDTALILVSELVTNAVLHARSEVTLTVVRTGGGLRMEVGDQSSLAPSVRRYSAEAATGRGLVLVESLADAWGSDIGPSGKTVWFELAPAVA